MIPLIRSKCPLCGGAVNLNGKCEKCGASYLKACELKNAENINRISMGVLILAALAAIFS